MKFINWREREEIKLGILTDRGVLKVAEAASELDMNVPLTLPATMAGGSKAAEALVALVEQAAGAPNAAIYAPIDELDLAPCVTDPGKIICIGLNYSKHAEETGARIPDYPILFNKFNNALSAHGDEVIIPKVTTKVDYEAELAIVIGKRAKDVSEEDALSYVFGYCCANDVSARDLQARTRQWLLGKSCDGFAPIGPYVATADEIADPNALSIQTTVNGELRQNSSTGDMIFSCKTLVSYISQHMTLLPGDIILTGTPEGVIVGYPPEQQVYLQDGDSVTISIEGLGELTNVMRAE
ncbi:fumarylacetoacetate hydrolase family protein [Paenibacillus daejeonensis]|uniref:fumarylacetoacetate hydrolase family protein n=1 Tax=Paenibacillus daejeonensis TaxID=135193 RepID=UPI000370CADC|nr:fumarylacetoacetate hydrolase family protein [Paenibacillus daejeonensis]